MTSQVILGGKAVGVTTAAEYYEKYFQKGWQVITKSLDRLAAEYDFVVCEGAGSPAEINLKHRDLTNMRIAKHLNAPTLLVVDIDRGGAFAHVVGTLQLLDESERALIKGVVINKFRGQRSLLDSGIEWLENYTGIPVLGVIPWRDISFSAEDSLDLLDRNRSRTEKEINITVLRLPRIANFTDFEPLDAESTVAIKYLDLHHHLGYPDAVIIPGSKTTIHDLMALHETGMVKQLQAYVAAGGVILGICGGFQMLGEMVFDPDQLESKNIAYPGLELLPIETVITPEKIVRQRQTCSLYPQSGFPINGYEIHQGITRLPKNRSQPIQTTIHALFDDSSLGMVNDNQSVWGCYLHGIFDNGAWRRTWLNYLRNRRGLPSLPTGITNYKEQREAILDNLADLVEEFVDLTPLLNNELI